jgi:hypothetical protein
MAGSRSTAPLNRSNSVLIIAPLSADESLTRYPVRPEHQDQYRRKHGRREEPAQGHNVRSGSIEPSEILARPEGNSWFIAFAKTPKEKTTTVPVFRKSPRAATKATHQT